MRSPEDVHRQETLERAGWTVVRIPYRSWRKDRTGPVDQVLKALAPAEEISAVDGPVETSGEGKATPALRLSRQEAAIFRAIASGEKDYEEVLRSARVQLGLARLGPRIRGSLESAIQSLQARGVVSNEDRELFIPENFKNAVISTYGVGQPGRSRRRSV